MARLVPTSTLAAAALMAVLSCACGGNITGHWCGTKVEKDEACNGDEVGYLLLKQSGDQVTGQACEAYEQDCYVIEDGVIDGSELSFSYTFGDNDEVEAKLAVTDDRMSGVLHASKCDCDIGFNFHRVE